MYICIYLCIHIYTYIYIYIHTYIYIYILYLIDVYICINTISFSRHLEQCSQGRLRAGRGPLVQRQNSVKRDLDKMRAAAGRMAQFAGIAGISGISGIDQNPRPPSPPSPSSPLPTSPPSPLPSGSAACNPRERFRHSSKGLRADDLQLHRRFVTPRKTKSKQGVMC